MHHIVTAPCPGKISRLPKKKFFPGQGEMKVGHADEKFQPLQITQKFQLFFTKDAIYR